MHTPTLLFLSALAVLTTALPAYRKRQDPSDSGALTLIAGRTIFPGQNLPINAANTSFYVNKPTISYCPSEEVPTCPAGITTVVEVGDGGASLYTEVPGGQIVYVLPTGALAFTPPHAEGSVSTHNGTTDGFSYNTASSVLSFTGLGAAGGFLACPVADSTTPYQYQIFAPISGISDANVPNGNLSSCAGFDALGTSYLGAPSAWEYE